MEVDPSLDRLAAAKHAYELEIEAGLVGFCLLPSDPSRSGLFTALLEAAIEGERHGHGEAG